MSIRISKQHGVNPSLVQCFYCGEDYGVALLGALPGDKPAPHRGVWNYEPCPKCADFMKMGVLCIGVDESKTDDPKNPYRDGNFCVVTTEAIARIVQPPTLVDEILRRRVTFIDGETWMKIGLPRPGRSGATKDHGHIRP
jgi:hypothetical protein